MPVDAIKAATDDVLTAALLGEGWRPALSRLAVAAGASDLVVIRNRRLVAAIFTPDIVEPIAAVLARRCPAEIFVTTRQGLLLTAGALGAALLLSREQTWNTT